ncbi:MAG: hypothetical protein IKS66_07285 [Oscillospiraceae bacterium]|nr:hypothetical protein [Oscillospiraceae bacterium]
MAIPFLQRGGAPEPGSPQLAPGRLELVITIVEKGKAGFYADLIQGFEANMQLILPAKGTASLALLQLLGLSDYEQAAILSVVRYERLETLMETLEQKFRSIKGGKGVSMAIPFSSLIGTAIYGFLSNDKRTVRGEQHERANA